MKISKFHTPDGSVIENIDLEVMKRYIIEEFETYWIKGSGDGFIDMFDNNEKLFTMMIGPNIHYGVYLHVIDYKNKQDWLSVYDKERLDDVAETADEIYVSIGLFLPKELAWIAIKDFLSDGALSKSVNWKHPEIIPENGNW